jgi:K+-sensing histidine kinase KdpD
MPSLVKTLPRWYWTVRGEQEQPVPISGFDSPSAASRAIWASCAVSSIRAVTGACGRSRRWPAARGRDSYMARLRQVTSDMGSAWYRLHADDPATALVEFARDERVTQIVLGASDGHRWQELVSGGSIVNRFSRLAARAGIARASAAA